MEEVSSASKTLKRIRNIRYYLVLEGIIVGAAAGLVTVLFRVVLEKASSLLDLVVAFQKENLWFAPLWFLILAVGAGAVTLLNRWEPMIGGSGIPQVEGEMQGQFQQSWWRVLIAKFTGGVLTIGAGLSLGREGPSIQLGAMAGKGFAKLTRRVKTEEKLLMTCGASAGLAAAFNAPFAGVLFSLEEVHKNFSVEVLLSAMSASITADFISRNIFGLKPVFDFSANTLIPLSRYWMVILLGILLGVMGVVYNYCIGKSQSLYEKIHNPYLKTLIPFLLAGVFVLIYPKVLGGGHHLVEEVSGGMALGGLVLLFGLKFIFSMVSFGSGVPGGIFLPLLVLGAVIGGIFSGLMQSLGLPSELQNFVILGMAGYFAAIVRAPVTGVILISEMTGGFSHLLTLTLVSLIAYAVADLMKAKPVYDQLLARLLKKRGKAPISGTGEKVLVETTVCHGAAICGKKLCQAEWPADCLMVSVRRGEEELVPNGSTVVLPGDTVVMLCDEGSSFLVHEALENQCMRVRL